jgi:RNA polymerase sigma-70 factor (ECF subfamily)
LAAHPAAAAEPRSANAAALLYRNHAARVFRFCLRFLRNRQDAEDAVQTTFLRAHGALERGTVPDVEEAWLLGIARNVCLSQVESSRRRGAHEVGCEPTSLEQAPAPELSDALGDIREALESIPESQRKAILLREWRGLSYREVADELGTSQPAVEALLFRARRSLATALGEQGQERRRRAGGLASVPVLGTLKSVVSGATAAQLAAGAATVTVVAAVAVATPLRTAIAPSGTPHRTAQQMSDSQRSRLVVSPSFVRFREPELPAKRVAATGSSHHAGNGGPTHPGGGHANGSAPPSGSGAAPNGQSAPGGTLQLPLPNLAPGQGGSGTTLPPVTVMTPPVHLPDLPGPAGSLPDVDLPDVEVPPVKLPVELPNVQLPDVNLNVAGLGVHVGGN